MRSIVRVLVSGAAVSALWLTPALAADTQPAHRMHCGSSCPCHHDKAASMNGKPASANAQRANDSASVQAVWQAP